MSLNPNVLSATDETYGGVLRQRRNADSPLVLLVDDNEETCVEMRHALEVSGYRVIDTDNGQDAAKRARHSRPDLVVVDLDVPLLYELVAARQIIKQAQIVVPIVIVTREEVADPYPMMEVGVRRNEYVTRLSDHSQLEHLLDFLLPVGPDAA
jgi:DNA-binding response OmpR family regulator